MDEEIHRPASFGEGTSMVITDGTDHLELKLVDTEVRAKLPFAVNITALSRDLRTMGYSLARDDEDTRSQGWGAVDDREDYMPFWVHHENDGWYFTFPPLDYHTPLPVTSAVDPGHQPRVGNVAADQLRRWLPVLRRARVR